MRLMFHGLDLCSSNVRPTSGDMGSTFHGYGHHQYPWLAEAAWGVSSPHYIPGPLAPNENAVYDWIQLVANAYAARPANLPR